MSVYKDNAIDKFFLKCLQKEFNFSYLSGMADPAFIMV